MAEIYNLNNNEKHCECPACELAREYSELIKTAENEKQLFDILRELISEAGELELVRFLQEDISQKAHLLDHLCGECDCE
jgi:hypothetical protein